MSKITNIEKNLVHGKNWPTKCKQRVTRERTNNKEK